MEASVRLLHSSHSLLRLTRKPPSPPRHLHPPFALHLPTPNGPPRPTNHIFSSPNHLPWQSSTRAPNGPTRPTNQFAHIFSSSRQNHPPFSWHYSSRAPNGLTRPKSPVITAVLLGWLGSKEKHLRRYIDLYKARGIDCVTFVAGVGDVLSFDLGARLEERIGALANELAEWVSKEGDDDRVLMFHTFSNTGWLA